MILIVNRIANMTLERMLASYGLQYFCEQSGFERDAMVYGCGSFVPGESYDELVKAYSNGELLGTIAMTVDEEILAVHEPELRQKLGHILAYSKRIFTTDFTSAEWCQHYDIQGAQHGGHPAWLCSRKGAENCIASVDGITVDIWNDPVKYIRKIKQADLFSVFDKDEMIGIIANDLGACIAGCLLEQPVVIMPNIGSLGFKQNAIGNHPVVRFAQRFNLMDNVVLEPNKLVEKLNLLRARKLKVVSPQLVEMAKIEAYATIEKLLPQPATSDDTNQVEDALAFFSGVQERVVDSSGRPVLQEPAPQPEKGAPKIINPGDPFDPETHYGKYYYGDGPGMVYTNPDGSKTRYAGPGRDWEGFSTVADIFRMIFAFQEAKPTIVSLGCGFGNDVLRFAKKGWDAWGCDISGWSVGQAHAAIKHRIILGNICDELTQEKLPEDPQLVVTFDFWEHIWLKDIDQLLSDLHKWMPKGSYMANIICTTGRNEKDMTVRPEDGFTQENSWFLISGHVTGRRWHWWANKFHEHGFRAALDKAYLFQIARTEDAAMSQSMSWRARNLLIVERS